MNDREEYMAKGISIFIAFMYGVGIGAIGCALLFMTQGAHP